MDLRILGLAEALSRIHGPVLVAKEKSGVHLYMASPKALEMFGRVELTKRHLAVNASKHFQIHEHIPIPGKQRRKRSSCAMCMKTGQPYSVADLLNMAPLDKRGIPDVKAEVKVQDNTAWIVDDGRGNKIPLGPGTCIPINQLPPEHPAVWYLTQYRKTYDLNVLWEQFRCSFCHTEYPESMEPKRFYRKLPWGFKDTPQGRIIFFGMIDGVQRTWQARVIDYDQDNIRYYLHPYTGQWVACEQRVSENGKFEPLPSMDRSRHEWEIRRYRNARGSSRNDVLLGLDAAVEWNRRMGRSGRDMIVGLVEGPLDAGRIGPPLVASTGKFLSPEQARMLYSRFHTVISIPDTDPIGLKAAEDARKLLDQFCVFRVVNLTDFGLAGKDLGDLNNHTASQLLQPFFINA